MDGRQAVSASFIGKPGVRIMRVLAFMFEWIRNYDAEITNYEFILCSISSENRLHKVIEGK